MTQLDSTNFKIQTQSLFPTNGVSGITAADLREQMNNIADSVVFLTTGKSVPPTANDDDANTSGAGVFQVGHIWVDEINNATYVCLDNSTSSAIWARITNTQSGIVEITASRSLELTDIGNILEIDTSGGAIVITLPSDSDLDIPIGTEFNITLKDATSSASISTQAGVEANGISPGSETIQNADYSTIRIYKRASDSWVVSGDIT